MFSFCKRRWSRAKAIKHKKTVLLHARMSSCRALCSFISAVCGEEEISAHMPERDRSPWHRGGRLIGLAFAAESVRVCRERVQAAIVFGQPLSWFRMLFSCWNGKRVLEHAEEEPDLQTFIHLL